MSLHESSWLMIFTHDAVGIWGRVKGREITRIKWPKCIDSSFGAEQSSMRRLPSDLNPRIIHGHAEIQWVP